MPTSIVISFVPEDHNFAVWLDTQLRTQHFAIFPIANQRAIHTAIKNAVVVIPLISPNSLMSQKIMQECAIARQHDRLVIPLLIHQVDHLPWYLEGLQIEDFTDNLQDALPRLISQLPTPNVGYSFDDARDAYLQRATLKSQHTINAYQRSIELFFMFLADRTAARQLPIQQKTYVLPNEIPLTDLAEEDAPLLLHFAQWLLSPSSGKSGDKRPYKPSTVQLRLAGVQNWLQFLDDYGWLPPQFPLAKAKRLVRDELRTQTRTHNPPQPPDHIEEVIYYYDNLSPPRHLRKPDANPDRVRRWELTRLRNRTLLHTLAETGGRISEILSLNLSNFPPRHLHNNEVLRVEVTGKGGHTYYLRFLDSLPVIRAYVEARGANLRTTGQGDVPLFISHDPRYEGNRTSRVVAWRVVQRAARALGLQNITPHDFRHWRATQLINAGHSLDVVQEYLGHRSVETTRAYYAHTDPLRVDDAAKDTGLPEPE
jgi:integrase